MTEIAEYGVFTELFFRPILGVAKSPLKTFLGRGGWGLVGGLGGLGVALKSANQRPLSVKLL